MIFWGGAVICPTFLTFGGFMYLEIYNLFVQYIYGNAALTSEMELTATIFATAACLFCVALPFVLVWRFIKLVSG